ncbi:hypothetical protein GW814_00135, partial [Candidatus Falkowbacteria bacterium]|nr:hypothetical protein [Candidatus Falkowbacteria bacterium]
FILPATLTIGSIAFNKTFASRIYPNVYIGNLNLGGKTAAQANRLLNLETDKISQHGVVFSYKNQRTTVKPVVASADADLAYTIINFKNELALEAAFNYGRNRNFLTNLGNKLQLLLSKKSIDLLVAIDQDKIAKTLKDNFADASEPARDADLAVSFNPATAAYDFSVREEKMGKAINFQAAIGELINNLTGLSEAEIKLATITEYPKILSRDCLNIDGKAEAILKAAPLTLKYGEIKWLIEQSQLAGLLALKPSGLAADKVRVGLDDDKTKAYFAEKITPQIDRPALEAKFEMQGGKVIKFQSGQDGRSLEADASIIKIENEILAGAPIELIVKIQPTLVSTDNVNNFGIKELVGVGRSNFTGSPANRRHNIKNGANTLNGILIKPGEEFSLNKALGKVDGATGYLPELVIKEGKTTPEFGGGLCQIGTTMFRAALDTGLPITMRKNHSYRVSYYEPAGTDATIYDPWPDLRFINDLASHILIQSKISGDDLSFEFWGRRDGRVVEKTKPTIYNIVKPEPAKIIETLELKPGEKRCTERAHNGADAYFDYKVTYADGLVKEKRFSSHYVPWQEVCLLGVEKLSVPPDTASSTPAVN